MKEVCGFKSLDGSFHNTRSSCEKADLDHKVDEVSRILNNFGDRLARYLYDYEQDSTGFRGFDIEHISSDYHYRRRVEESILQAVSKKILRDSDDFLVVIAEKRKLEKELDQLQSKRDSWWLKIKWW